MRYGKKFFALLLCVFMWPQDLSATPGNYYTSSLLGPLGLNVIPSARMDKAGTISAGISTLDPYVHGYLGIQIADPLFINLRQTALVSNINEEAERLYPGVDLKLRLAKETGVTPEISLGLQNAIGHKRMAGEYLAFSKRYQDFDFTLGLGWGRFANKGHITNPFKIFGSHFDKERGVDQEMPNEPGDWFTGDKIGFFGGVEYFTKIDGLSLKADWGADRYEMEQAAFDYNAPAPWSVGAVYRPFSWMDVALAAQGMDKVMGRLSFHGNMEKWPWTNKVKDNEDAVPMRAYRTGLALPSQMELAAERETMLLYETATDIHRARAMLDLDPSLSAPAQYGRAVKHISNHGGPEIEEISLTPTVMNLRGPSVRLLRRDFEQALTRKQGSPQEAWRNVEFAVDGEKRPAWGTPTAKRVFETEIILDNEIGLSEEDSGLLHRKFPHR